MWLVRVRERQVQAVTLFWSESVIYVYFIVRNRLLCRCINAYLIWCLCSYEEMAVPSQSNATSF